MARTGPAYPSVLFRIRDDRNASSWRSGVLCLFGPALFVAAVFYLAVVRYCCITAPSSSFVLCFDGPVHQVQLARRPVADHEPWTFHELLSFMLDDDSVPDASRLQKYWSSPLGPSGPGKKHRTCHIFEYLPSHSVRPWCVELCCQVNFHTESFFRY